LSSRPPRLISVRAGDQDAVRIEQILDRFRPTDPVQRGKEYRTTRWTTFDPKAPPYRLSAPEIDRMRSDWAP
jgi:hypothetical protein